MGLLITHLREPLMSNREWISRFTEKLRKQERDLADKFFKKETTSAVDFEIALAAFLATLCLQYPVTGLEVPISQLSAFCLLIVTLGRRIAVSSPYAPDKILERTVILIEVSTTSCLISIFVAFGYRNSIPYLSEPLQFVLFSLPVMLFLALVHEVVFRDYMIWWHAKFLEKAENGDTFSDVWLVLSVITIWSSKYYRDLPEIERHRQNLPSRKEFKEKFDLPIKDYFRLLLKVGGLFRAIYILPIVPSIVLFGVDGIALIPAIVAIHDQSAFWYVGYGDTSYEDFRRKLSTKAILSSIYILEVGYLLHYYSISSIVDLV